MAQKKGLTQDTKRKIIDYLALLKKEGIEIEKAIIFGSYAKGEIKPWSDIDVCLISKKFGKDIFEEGVIVSRLARKIDSLIEPHPYHPLDFQEKYDSLATEIKKHGIAIL